MNPYLVLNVPPDADDQTVRRAYLAAIKLATPESDPARFQALTAAYERIKDEPSRHRYTLFHDTPPGHTPLEAFRRTVVLLPTPAPMPFEEFKTFLRACARP